MQSLAVLTSAKPVGFEANLLSYSEDHKWGVREILRISPLPYLYLAIVRLPSIRIPDISN